MKKYLRLPLKKIIIIGLVLICGFTISTKSTKMIKSYISNKEEKVYIHRVVILPLVRTQGLVDQMAQGIYKNEMARKKQRKFEIRFFDSREEMEADIALEKSKK